MIFMGRKAFPLISTWGWARGAGVGVAHVESLNEGGSSCARKRFVCIESAMVIDCVLRLVDASTLDGARGSCRR